MRFILRRSFYAVGFILTACSDNAVVDTPVSPHPADAIAGRFAFVAECATCHASGDGIDLATFQFADSTIVRRAVKHVDSVTARNIVAHIRSLSASVRSERTKLFQPGEAVASSDMELATTLFGGDQFPADMTTQRMRSIDTRTLRVAVSLPIWSDEQSDLDWMPDSPLLSEILDDQGGLARAAIAGYRAAPTKENLIRAVTVLRSADRRIANAGAPCLLEDSLRVNFVQCFDVRKWTSTLVAQHLLRYGMSATLDLALHDVFWDVGNAARKSIRNNVSPIPNAKQNWAAWMYMSWSFDPSQHPSVYTGGGLNNIGLPRHATFLALRSAVARAVKTSTPYTDVQNAAAFAPSGWVLNVTKFGFQHLNDRLDSGEKPEGANLTAARDAVTQAIATAQRRVPDAQRATIASWGNQLLARLQ